MCTEPSEGWNPSLLHSPDPAFNKNNGGGRLMQVSKMNYIKMVGAFQFVCATYCGNTGFSSLEKLTLLRLNRGVNGGSSCVYSEASAAAAQRPLQLLHKSSSAPAQTRTAAENKVPPLHLDQHAHSQRPN